MTSITLETDVLSLPPHTKSELPLIRLPSIVSSLPTDTSILLEEVTELEIEDFRHSVIQAVSNGAKLHALFATPRESSPFHTYAIWSFDDDQRFYVARTALDGHYAAITPDCPTAHMFERELHELWDIKPIDHPFLKPVRYTKTELPGATDFFQMEGPEIHEVAVGPIHAGVIEPGHFRFQCHGEHVYHLEIALGFQHRGIEKALIGGPHKRTLVQMETIAGDTSIGHGTAYCQVLETLMGIDVPVRANRIRAIALELERLANHIGDMGGISNDVGFLPTAAFCGRLRGDFLNASALICGNRFGRSIVTPGGVIFDIEDTRQKKIQVNLDKAVGEVLDATGLLWKSSMVIQRLRGTGRLSRETAQQLGLVGPAARACGIDYDVRQHRPFGIFKEAPIGSVTQSTGDVYARAMQRETEIRQSAAIISRQLRQLIDEEKPIATPTKALKPNSLAVSLVEGWRGEICHVALTDGEGRFASYKIIDPSFHNWTGLAVALRGQTISDFPLCNKSFNLSYCGHDL